MGRSDNKRTIDRQWSVNECIGELYEITTALRSDMTEKFNGVNDQLYSTDKSLLTINKKLEQSLKTSARLKIWLVVLTVIPLCLVLTKLFIDL